MKSSTRLFFGALLGSLIVGCGGGSSSTTSALVGPLVGIDWPATSRNISAPAYATSAAITITPSSSSAITWTVDRPADALAHSVTYTGPVTNGSAPAVLSVAFKSGAGGTGTTVATATVSVKIGADGTILNSSGGPLGTIAYSSQLTGLTITVPDTPIGSTSNITAVGQSSSGVVALPQTLVSYSITSGASNATIAKNVLTGVAEGSVTVQANYESLTASQSANVTTKLMTQTNYAFPANRIAYDSLHSKVWGTFSAASAYPNAIVDLDISTGAIGTPITVGSDPEEIAVSSDGTTAYVGLNGAKSVQIVDLTSRTLGASINLDAIESSSFAVSLAVNPTNSQEVAICMHSSNNGANRGPGIFRNGVLIGSVPGIYSAGSSEYVNGTDVVQIQTGISSGSITRSTISTSTVVNDVTRNTNQYLNGNVKVSGTIMVLDDGQAFSTVDLSTVGQILYGNEGFGPVATDRLTYKAWIAVVASSPTKVRCFELGNFTQVEAQVLPTSNGISQMIRYGAKGLIILAGTTVYIVPIAPGT